MAGKNLDEWADDKGLTEGTIGAWMAARPDIAEQVRAGRQPAPHGGPKYTLPQIANWLKEEHQFPFGYKSLSPWLLSQ